MPDKIRLAFPGQKLKIIMLLREPIMRAYSYFAMQVQNGFIKVSCFVHVDANQSSGVGLD